MFVRLLKEKKLLFKICGLFLKAISVQDWVKMAKVSTVLLCIHNSHAWVQ